MIGEPKKPRFELRIEAEGIDLRDLFAVIGWMMERLIVGDGYASFDIGRASGEMVVRGSPEKLKEEANRLNGDWKHWA